MMSYIQLIQCDQLDFCSQDCLPINNWFPGFCLVIVSEDRIAVFELLVKMLCFFVVFSPQDFQLIYSQVRHFCVSGLQSKCLHAGPLSLTAPSICMVWVKMFLIL